MNFQEFLAFLLVFLLCFPRSSLQFPEWVGEKGGSVLLGSAPRSSFDPTRVTQLSWRPRAFLYKGFLSFEECDHLITLAKDELEKSTVVDSKSGESVISEVRTSSGMFLYKAQGLFGVTVFLVKDEIVADIESRIAAWTFLPIENGEAIQVLRYENGEKYEPHFDTFNDKYNVELGGNRIATVLMYLSFVKEGGETVFPNLEEGLSQPKDGSWSDCAKRGYAVRPRKGDALLFFSMHPNTTMDESSLHGSCPVIAGEKWSATKWIRVRYFGPRAEEGGCVDEDEDCSRWAAVGECEKNPAYMVGSDGANGHCRKSCGVC